MNSLCNTAKASSSGLERNCFLNMFDQITKRICLNVQFNKQTLFYICFQPTILSKTNLHNDDNI